MSLFYIVTLLLPQAALYEITKTRKTVVERLVVVVGMVVFLLVVMGAPKYWFKV